jgi:hypothetical protein
MYSVSSMLAACTELLEIPSRARALGIEDVEKGMESATWRGNSPSGALAANGKYKVMVLPTCTNSSWKKSPWAKYSSELWSRPWDGLGDECFVGPDGERSPHINQVRENASAAIPSFGLFTKLVSAPFECFVCPEGERSPHINQVKEYASATVSSFGLFTKLVSAP